MKISREWLSQYVDFEDLSDQAFCDLITTRVAEVDAIERSGEPIQSAVIALIQSVKPHQTKKEISIVSLHDGKSAVQVVCGAENCREGQLVVYVPPGGVVYEKNNESLKQIESREISGVQSHGVLVSELELGIGSDHEGIFVVSSDQGKPGEGIAKVVGRPDTVLVIDNKSLTHRPDLWGHFGFAREVSAILHRPLKFQFDLLADDTEAGRERLAKLGAKKSGFTIRIDSQTKCSRFMGIEFRGVRSERSPLWMRRRLHAVGAGIRSFLIDLSNYVMHDVGQPNHAYDIRTLSGETIAVRMAKEEERFLALDDIERKLTTEDVVIADTRSAIALAGVIGGKDTSIKDSTTDLFLESANFDPVLLRLTTKRHQLRTDASNRFEKNQSPYSVPLAAHRFYEILRSVQPGVEASEVTESFVSPPKPVSISFSPKFIQKRLGAPVPETEIASILKNLGFSAENFKGEERAKVPYYRATRDIEIVEDLVEEVGRVYGYENIQEQAPLIESRAQISRKIQILENTLQDSLRALGFSQIYNYSFMNADTAQKMGYSSEDLIVLENPIDAECRVLRSSLIPGMLEVVNRNARFTSTFLLFELGRSYHAISGARSADPKNPAIKERRLLTLAYSLGRKEEELAEALSVKLMSGACFYGLADTLRRVVRLLTRTPLDFEPTQIDESSSNVSCSRPWMHPYRNAALRLSGNSLGVISEVNSSFLENNSARTVCAELDLDLLLDNEDFQEFYIPLAKYPESFFEISVIMPEKTPFLELENLLFKAVSGSVLKKIEVLQVYTGEPLPLGTKSISVKLFFQANDRTLSGSELTAIQQQVITSVMDSAFSLRS